MANDDIAVVVATYVAKRNNHLSTLGLGQTGFVVPNQAMATSVSKFATIMDDATRNLIHVLPDMNPIEWEAFIELVPNVRKILGMTE